MVRGAKPQPDERSRRPGQRKGAMRLVTAEAAKQPALPQGATQHWPTQTVNWWRMWGKSPLTAEFTANDWSELLDTARIHAKLWDPRVPSTIALKAAAELRQRAAKFGATPEDRMRLRIQFAMADTAEVRADAARTRQAAASKGAKARRGPHLVGEEDAS